MYYLSLSLSILLLSSNAHAYDPYSAFQVGSSALKVVGSIFGGIDELTGSASALNDLYSEIDSSGPVNESSQKLISEIEQIGKLYEEIGYSGSEAEASASALKAAKNFTETVRGITHAIKSAKKVAQVFGGLEKRSQSANVESANLEREILNVQIQALNEQKLSSLRAIRSDLEEVARKKRFVRDINADLQDKGARVIGGRGLLRFPEASLVIEDGLKVAMQVRPYLIGLILFVLFLRVGFNLFSFRASEAYGDVIRDSIVCILVLSLFPELVRACFSIPYSIANQIKASDTPFYSSRDVMNEIAALSIPGSHDDSAFKSAFLILLQGWWAGLRYFMYALAGILYKYILLVMVALTPFIIFLSEMFNFPVGWKLFFLTFISINLWPILWNVFGILVESSGAHGSGMSELLETFTVMVLQFCSPVMIYFFAKAMSNGILGNGTQASRAIAGVSGPIGSKVKSTTASAWGRFQNPSHSQNIPLTAVKSVFYRKPQKPVGKSGVNLGK